MDFCVLIPYYNDYEGLILSLKSIQYDASQYQILIVDDGSEIPVQSTSIIKDASLICRLDIIRLAQNSGITEALNTGLRWINDNQQFRFVARLDCGDQCHPLRFYKQVEFLNAHSEIDFIGSWCKFMNDAGKVIYTYKTPTQHHDIQRAMYFRNVFIHPTVMWRTAAVSLYPENFLHAEDYGLFYRILNQSKTAILPIALVTCKLKTNGISTLHRRKQLNSRIDVIKHFGKNKFYVALGTLKIELLKVIPYHLILQLKRIVSPA